MLWSRVRSRWPDVGSGLRGWDRQTLEPGDPARGACPHARQTGAEVCRILARCPNPGECRPEWHDAFLGCTESRRSVIALLRPPRASRSILAYPPSVGIENWRGLVGKARSPLRFFHPRKIFQNPWRDWAAENALDR